MPTGRLQSGNLVFGIFSYKQIDASRAVVDINVRLDVVGSLDTKSSSKDADSFFNFRLSDVPPPEQFPSFSFTGSQRIPNTFIPEDLNANFKHIIFSPLPQQVKFFVSVDNIGRVTSKELILNLEVVSIEPPPPPTQSNKFFNVVIVSNNEFIPFVTTFSDWSSIAGKQITGQWFIRDSVNTQDAVTHTELQVLDIIATKITPTTVNRLISIRFQNEAIPAFTEVIRDED